MLLLYFIKNRKLCEFVAIKYRYPSPYSSICIRLCHNLISADGEVTYFANNAVPFLSLQFSFQFQSLQFRMYVIRVRNGNAE